MDPLQYILFALLFFLSAFFSGSELALMGLPNHKVQSMVKNGRLGAKALRDIKQNNDRLLIAILIGNNLVNVYTAALATQIAISISESGGLPLEQSAIVGIATGIITLLLLIFGEIVPKSIATKNAEKVSLLVAYPLKMLLFILYPIVVVLEFMIKVFTGESAAAKVTKEEIETYIDLGREVGSINESKYYRLIKALDFDDKLVEEIMVPRVKVDALPDSSTVQEAYDYYMEHTHSRIPVYKDRIDSIVGIINIRDILREIKKGNANKRLEMLHFKSFIKSPINQPIEVLFETFKKNRQHMAIIIDEYGGVAGITTIEDIIEEIFGEIHDETDFESAEIIQKSDGSYVIESSILMENMLDEFGLDLINIGLDEKEFGTETVSYMITHQLERFPVKGEEISFRIYDDEGEISSQKIFLKVLDISEEAIGKVEVTRKNAEILQEELHSEDTY